jgi:hypothetical protein
MNFNFDFASLKKALSSLGKHTEDIRSTLASIRERIDSLKAEQKALRARPVTREDWLNMCLAHIDNTADAQAKELGIRLHGYAGHSGPFGPNCRADAADYVLRAGNSMGGTFPLFDSFQGLQSDPPFSQNFACLILRDNLKEAVRKAFEEHEERWCLRDTIPSAEAFARLDAIKAELAELERQEMEIVSQAEALGVDVPKRSAN